MYCYDKEKLPVPIIKDHDEWQRLYDCAWETVFKNIEYIDKPGWKPQLTCMPGVGIVWQWDSCFLTFITNYSNGTLSAFNNLDNLYRLRRESDGFMAMAYNIETEKEAYPGRINPPLMAWSEWEYYKISGDKSRLGKVLPALEGIFSFIENNRRHNCGLYWFEDSGSSGMDNSPRGGYLSTHLDGCDICHIDLACQQALSAKSLSDICMVLGDEGKSSFFKKEHKRICELINKYHWCESAGWYFDFFIRSNPNDKVKYINSKTAAAFWTIICGCATGRRKEAMLSHILNYNEFYTEVPFASLSRDDPNYDKNGGYWLGSVWPPTNYVLIKGLADNGYPELAREAAIKFLNAMARVNDDKTYGGIWEAYAPEAIRPALTEDGSMVRSDFVGWGGLAPITMLIEDVIGLNFNALDNTVTFRLFPNQMAGLKNMNFAGGKVSIECTKYNAVKDGSVVRVESDTGFTLIIKAGYLWQDVVANITAGVQEIKV